MQPKIISALLNTVYYNFKANDRYVIIILFTASVMFTVSSILECQLYLHIQAVKFKTKVVNIVVTLPFLAMFSNWVRIPSLEILKAVTNS